MEYSSKQLDILLSSKTGDHCLEFVFKDKFTYHAGIEGSKAWSNIFDQHPSTYYSLLWDCTRMTGFEPAARNEWYQCMKKYKHRITKVTVVSGSIIIRGAAKVMLQFFGLKTNVFKTMDELMEKV